MRKTHYRQLGSNLESFPAFCSIKIDAREIDAIEMDAREIIEPPAKKRKQYAGNFQDDWKRVFNGVIAPSKLGDHYAWCVVFTRRECISVRCVRLLYTLEIENSRDKREVGSPARTVDCFLQAESPDAGFDDLRRGNVCLLCRGAQLTGGHR